MPLLVTPTAYALLFAPMGRDCQSASYRPAMSSKPAHNDDLQMSSNIPLGHAFTRALLLGLLFGHSQCAADDGDAKFWANRAGLRSDPDRLHACLAERSMHKPYRTRIQVHVLARSPRHLVVIA